MATDGARKAAKGRYYKTRILDLALNDDRHALRGYGFFISQNRIFSDNTCNIFFGVRHFHPKPIRT
ncbi:hypothetical protein [Thermoanaerobacterium sp. DL9XJH110]|uniref:hypothetical protein n=1 Tax=Thermoanaerobacterium sp. DL9XJH110 TaxID=3386643 RepID=UPI003BB6FB0C